MQTTRGTSLTEHDSPDKAGGPPLRPSMRRIILLGTVAVAVIVIDLLTKLAVVANMTMYDTHDVVDGLLKITYTRNAGAAFSVGEGMTAIFGLVAIAVAVAIVRTARTLRSLTWAITLGLLLGGAIGNLGDRVFRSPGFLRGHVVDWIELPHWPVFNLADSAIVCGGVIAVILSWRGIAVDGSHDKRHGLPAAHEHTGQEHDPAEAVES
ncbi:MAG: signal peptidase [Frankiales bacterium]|nr:signal peptidase [Frankiales bacterium]